MAERTGIMTVEDFVREFTQDGPFEIIDDERIPLVVNVAIHQYVVRAIFLQLYNFGLAHKSGEVIFETPFVLEDAPGWVKGSRVPDVMFIAAPRWAEYIAQRPDWKGKPYLIVPDLVIEVLSPEDRYSEMYRKIAVYLEDGVKQVWLIDPQKERAFIHRAGSDEQTMLTASDRLTGGDLLPGFEVVLGDLFPA